MYDDVGHTDEATKELKEIFGGNIAFPTTKPLRLIERILQIGCPDEGLVLDAFAGSGTTGHAIMLENQRKHANRHFILVEMMDYADTLTAERLRKAVNGYPASKKHAEPLYEKKLTASNLKDCQKFYEDALSVKERLPDGKYDKVEGPKVDNNAIVVYGITNKGENVPGIDTGFSYCELGEPLFEEYADNDLLPFINKADMPLNQGLSRNDAMRYVWYTETKSAYVDHTDQHPYLMGQVNDTVYYLAWEPDRATTLSYELLSTLPVRGTTTVIYADRCVLDQPTLEKLGIRFKQIPRQIARM